MAKRNGTPIELIWFHMDATHAVYAQAITAMRNRHEAQGPFKLSINLKDDGSEALVKVANPPPGWQIAVPWAPAVIRKFAEADHDQAVTLVRDPIWEPLL